MTRNATCTSARRRTTSSTPRTRCATARRSSASSSPRWRAWSRPLEAYGRNPLAAYFLSVGFDSVLTRWRAADGVSLKAVLYRVGFVPWLRPCCGAEAASLGYAIAYVALWGVILGELYRRRVFIRI